jgi:hypothetical protein
VTRQTTEPLPYRSDAGGQGPGRPDRAGGGSVAEEATETGHDETGSLLGECEECEGEECECEEPVTDVVDPESGFPRILEAKCDTCIYRPGNLMGLRPGRREQIEEDAIAVGAWVVCHSTIHRGDVADAICRGFVDVARERSAGLVLMAIKAARHGLIFPQDFEVPLPPTRGPRGLDGQGPADTGDAPLSGDKTRP